MSWELDNIKREVDRIKYDIYRKVEDETYRRDMHNLEQRCDRISSDIQRLEYEMNQKFEQLNALINEHIESANPS